MTVYITHEVRGRDLSNALVFGDLEVLVPADIQIATTKDAFAVSEMIGDALEGFCDEDYLLLAGDPVCIGLACAWASEYNDGRYRILKWDRLEERYLPVQVDMWEPERTSSHD